MGFPTVKSSPWGLPQRSRSTVLWSERRWRVAVLESLLAVESLARRKKIASATSFCFTKQALEVN
jgi:hypothetical protein